MSVPVLKVAHGSPETCPCDDCARKRGQPYCPACLGGWGVRCDHRATGRESVMAPCAGCGESLKDVDAAGYRRGLMVCYPALKAAYDVAAAKYEVDHDAYGAAWSRWRISGLRRRNTAPVAPVRPVEPKKPRHEVEHWSEPRTRSDRFKPWDRDNVYADDVSEKVQKRIAAHNRTVLVLQGLLDRSPIWNPHPKWELWDPAGFKAALVLVYDDARALVAGEKPDFEAYRARLHAQITPESVFVGQRRIWLEEEAKKENARRDRDHRRKNDWRLTVYEPDGNRGPDRVSVAERVTKTQATFRWTRRRERVKRDWSGRTDDSPIPVSLSVPLEKLFNVSAYKPGDFRQFFADVRTRAEYVQWAPFLLAAEDWHCAPPKPVVADEDGYHKREIG